MEKIGVKFILNIYVEICCWKIEADEAWNEN